MAANKYLIARIEWVDSSSFPNGPWITEEEVDRQIAEHGALKCLSIGFVVRENADIVVISSSVAEGMIMEPMAIPKVAITKRESLGIATRD
jgi:hypothetical protein